MRKMPILFICFIYQNCIALATPLPRLLAFDDYLHAICQRQASTEETNFRAIKEALQEAYAKPLDLNTVTKDELSSLGILSKEQITYYFNHLSNTGPLYSKYELQAIPGFDLLTIKLLLPFVYVRETYQAVSNLGSIQEKYYNHILLNYVPTPRPINLNARATLGSLDAYKLQIAGNHINDLTWGLTGRKQAGESFSWDHTTHRYGFNLWSIFLMIDNQKYFKRIIIGDYQVGHGQGLLLSAGYVYKGDAFQSIIRFNKVPIVPYKGTKRIGLRGIAITSDIGPIELTSFYASNNLDATLHLDQEGKQYTNSIDRSGKYDTKHNLEKKGTINEQLFGCTIRKQYYHNQREVGVNLLYHHYDIPTMIHTKLKNFEDAYCLEKPLATSLFYRFLWKNWIFFGEAGLTLPYMTTFRMGNSLITGCIISLCRYLDLSIGLYYYGKAWYAPYGNAFKRYTTEHGNEKGIYGALILTPLSSWQTAISSHFFATLSPKPQLSLPSSGHRFTTRSHYIYNRATTFIISYKFDKKPKNSSKPINTVATPTIAHVIQNMFKSKIEHKLTEFWWICLEAQYTLHTFLGQTHHGYALSTSQKWQKNRWKFIWKPIYFNTQNYATRLYFYQPNTLYGGTQFLPYHGNGIATICLVCWKPTLWLNLAIKYAFTYTFNKLHKTTSKSINNAPSGNHKHNGAIQLLLKF